MKKILSLLASLLLLICCIVPVYAAETVTVNGLVYPRNYFCNEQWNGINSDALLQVDCFKLSIYEPHREKISKFYVNLYFSDGAFSLWSAGYDVDDVVVLRYDNLESEAANQGYDISELTGVEVSVNSSETILCVIDAQEEAGFVSKIITAISDGWNNFCNRIEELFADFFAAVEDYQNQKNLLVEIWDKLLLTLQDLWDVVTQKPTLWIYDFFDSLSSESIAVWREFFDFPIIKDLLMMVILVALIGGIFKMFISV